MSVKLYRYDPSTDKEPRYEQFSVPYAKQMRIMDVLNYIYEDLSHPFAYRWFCGTKRCGGCGVTVNGKPVLSCWEPAQKEMIVEPLKHFPVIRDVAVDFSENERFLTELKPILVRTRLYESFPERITHDQMKTAYDLMFCIDCRICVSACRVMDPLTNKGFAGPYALVQLAKIATDPRNDADLTESILKAKIQDCQSCNDCTPACPSNVPILRGAIDQLRDKMIHQRVYHIRGWRFIKKLPPFLRKLLRCQLKLTLGEAIKSR